MGSQSRYDRDVLKKARKSSLMTQAELAEKIGRERGKRIYPRTMVQWEKNPENVPLSVLGSYYNLCGTDAKTWIRDFVCSFFH